MQNLRGKVAVVAGATRGTGRGIAVELGAAGATVYCTGRTTRAQRSDLNRAETIEETAERVTAAGGVGIAVQVDHTQEKQVKALFERVQSEQNGQLDILVNDIWGGEALIEWGKPFWELDHTQTMMLLERTLFTHMLTARYGVPLMIARGSGLIIEVTDGDNLDYRGQFIYDLVKTTIIRMGKNMAEDLKAKGHANITALTVTPGFLRSEYMLDHFGVTEANWRDAIAKEPYYAESETPHYMGRGVAALASDPNIHAKAGGVYASWTLMDEYGFSDVDGRQPHWGRFFKMMQEKQAQA